MRDGPLRLLGKVTLREQGSDLFHWNRLYLPYPKSQASDTPSRPCFCSPPIFPLGHGFTGGSDGKEFCLPMQETQVQSLGREDPLEEEVAIHSTILAWRLPWTEEPGGLQSVRLPTGGHD